MPQGPLSEAAHTQGTWIRCWSQNIQGVLERKARVMRGTRSPRRTHYVERGKSMGCGDTWVTRKRNW